MNELRQTIEQGLGRTIEELVAERGEMPQWLLGALWAYELDHPEEER